MDGIPGAICHASPLLCGPPEVAKIFGALQNRNRATICPCRAGGIPAAVVLSQPKPPVVWLFGTLLLTLVGGCSALVEVGAGNTVRLKALVNSARILKLFLSVILNRRPIPK